MEVEMLRAEVVMLRSTQQQETIFEETITKLMRGFIRGHQKKLEEAKQIEAGLRDCSSTFAEEAAQMKLENAALEKKNDALEKQNLQNCRYYAKYIDLRDWVANKACRTAESKFAQQSRCANLWWAAAPLVL